MLDGCINDALCNTDEVHLNGAGTSKLLMNLGLVYAEKTYSDVLSNGINKKNPLEVNIKLTHNGQQFHDFCGVLSHMRRQCNNIRCHTCNEKGHKACFCDA